MTNSKYDTISGSDYVDVESELSISFTTGTNYQIQIINPAYICEADTKPTEGGFLTTSKPFIYTHGSSKLWVCPKTPYLPIKINVAEGVAFNFANINVTTPAEQTTEEP
jgi:hypothetical protein